MNLKVLTPCEKVIQDARSGPSLIATFQEMQVGIPEGQILPTNAVIPKDWAIFALWHSAESESFPTFRQWLVILWPDGSEFIRQPLDVKVDKPEWTMSTVQIQGFPMGQKGRLTIRVWIEVDNQMISEVGETWIDVKHLASNPPTLAGVARREG